MIHFSSTHIPVSPQLCLFHTFLSKRSLPTSYSIFSLEHSAVLKPGIGPSALRLNCDVYALSLANCVMMLDLSLSATSRVVSGQEFHK